MPSNSPEKKIRVLLAEDHTLVRQGFRRILEDDPRIVVVGEASTGLKAIELVKELKPEIVVMDLAMPELGGLEASAEILKVNPQTKILILSMYSNEAYVRKAFEMGAKGFGDCAGAGPRGRPRRGSRPVEQAPREGHRRDRLPPRVRARHVGHRGQEPVDRPHALLA